MRSEDFKAKADSVFAKLGMRYSDCGDTYAAALAELSRRFARCVRGPKGAQGAALCASLAAEAGALGL